jgi:CDP-diacylglycerol--glycerol-3-phosphate 3-phosphatidyltransferase
MARNVPTRSWQVPMTALTTLPRGPLVPVNLPNALTLGRLLVVPLFAVLLLTTDAGTGVRVLLWGLFTVACLTDVVDGRLARSRGQVTTFGILADPIADKALVGTALVGLSLLGELPWWATVVVLGRELGVTLLRTWAARRAATVIPAGRGGKLKALTQNCAVALYLLPLPAGAAAVRLPVLVLAVVATVVTGVDYALRARGLTRVQQPVSRRRTPRR